jgi:hypothetical protein
MEFCDNCKCELTKKQNENISMLKKCGVHNVGKHCSECFSSMDQKTRKKTFKRTRMGDKQCI